MTEGGGRLIRPGPVTWISLYFFVYNDSHIPFKLEPTIHPYSITIHPYSITIQAISYNVPSSVYNLVRFQTAY